MHLAQAHGAISKLSSLDHDTITKLLVEEEIKKSSREKTVCPDLSLLDEMWIAWSAGFVDGEGAVTIHSSKIDYSYVLLRVTQVNIAPLERLKMMYGGRLREVKKQPIWAWSVSSDHAIKVLSVMRPYLMVKGAHADVAIEFHERCIKNKADGREGYITKISSLQMKGPRRKGQN